MGAPRIDLPDIPYHVYSRGNNKGLLFFDERDRLTYLKILREAREKFSFAFYAYALMDNHIHLLLKMLGTSSLSRLMHRVQLFYAQHINRKYGRVGHVFQSRYHGILVDSDRYFMTVERYISLNPVHAGMVARPEDFPWSSYRSRLHLRDGDWLAHGPVLDYFGRGEDRERVKTYKEFTESGIHLPEEWSDDVLRKSTYLGSAEFGQKIQSLQAKHLRLRHPSSNLLPSSDLFERSNVALLSNRSEDVR